MNLPKAEAFSVLSRKLVQTRAIVLEVLRLHPPVMRDLKICIEDNVMDPDGSNIPVKKGTAVFYLPYVMGRNPLIWEDPLKFDHTRFLTKRDDSGRAEDDGVDTGGKQRRKSIFRPSAVSDYKYPVFNAGPRLCLGRGLALLETQLVLVALLQRYKIRPAPREGFSGKHNVTVVSTADGGIPCVLERRLSSSTGAN